MRRLLIVTNIPSPYRVDFFHYLQQYVKEYDIYILFQAGNDKSFRTWNGGEEKLRNTCFLKSKVIKRTGYDQTEKIVPYGVRKAMNSINPDVVVCMEYNPCAIMVKHWCNRKKVPYISWTDGTRNSEKNISLVQRLSRKYIMRNTAAFIASSTAARENQIYLGADKNRIFISYLTVDIDRYSELSEVNKENQELKMLYVGSLIRRKGIDLLLDALGELVNESWSLEIVGSGPEKDALADQAGKLGIENKIRFSGFVEGEALKEAYERSDLFILPTREDCYGLVILEAMCCALPVISSKYADGAFDLIEDGKNGYITDPYDKKEMAEKMSEFIKDRNKAVIMGQNGRKKAGEFAFENVADGFVKAIESTENV